MHLNLATNKDIEKIKSIFGVLDIHLEENIQELYSVGILDRINRVLSLEEADEMLLSFNSDWTESSDLKREYLRYEKLYLDFFQYVFLKNKKQSIYIYSSDLHEYGTDLLRKYLDKDDMGTLVDIFTKPINGKVFMVKEKKVLDVFVKLSIREVCFSNFFFLESKTVIIGNYEMSLPIYSLENCMMEDYESKANQLGLFIRK